MYRFWIFLFIFIHIGIIKTIPIARISSNSFPNIFENSNSFYNGQRVIHPGLIQVLIKKIRNDFKPDEELDGTKDERQIPVISEIERIKKAFEIIEFVGDKVGDLIDKIDLPTTDQNELIYNDNNFENSTIEM